MNSNKIIKILILIIIILSIFSCSPQKKLIYLQDKNSSIDTSKYTNRAYEYKVKSGDLLFIRIITLEEKSDNFFNTDKITNYIQDQGIYLYSYTVSDSGNIDMPIIGKVYVKDFSVFQIKEILQKFVDMYLKGAIVIVKLTNFKITILGEVNKPGTFKVYENSVSIIEAIGLASDLTIYGDRQKIMIIRQNENNKVYFVDITDRKLIHSNQFYLLPNDIIYVSALKAKSYGFNTFPFATILSGITTLLLLLNFLK